MNLSETYPTPNGLPIGFDNGFTLTNERTDGLTNDLQDQGSNRLVLNAPKPVDNRIPVPRQGFPTWRFFR